MADEPCLKYERLSGDIPQLLQSCSATCLAVSDKLLALGTSAGSVHILDYEGNEVNQFSDHRSAVTDLCLDSDTEWLGSSAQDGSVTVRSLYGEEVTTMALPKAVHALALDPRYGVRKSRELVAGGAAGQLLLCSRGWLGNRTTVLHSGEGPISAVRWAGSLVAWANPLGVKVYDMNTHRRVGYIETPHARGPMVPAGPRGPRCSLHWQQDQLLYIAWDSCVQVVRITYTGGTPVGAPLTVVNQVQSVSTVAQLRCPCQVLSAAPFGPDIAYLAVETPTEQTESAQDTSNASPHIQLRVATWRGIEHSVDPLPQDLRQPTDGQTDRQVSESSGQTDGQLSLSFMAHHAAAHPSIDQRDWRPDAVESVDGGPVNHLRQWCQSAAEAPVYFVLAPKCLLLARPRDTNDRIQWLLAHKRYQEALQVAQGNRTVKAQTMSKIADAYLEHLIEEKQYTTAAALTPELLKDDVSAWERWVYQFAQLRQLPLLAPYLPGTQGPSSGPQGSPRAPAATQISKAVLRPMAYEMVVTAFLPDPALHSKVLQALQQWPPSLYNAAHMSDLLLQRMRAPGGDSLPLLQSLALLYSQQGRSDLALNILLRLRDPHVFQFVQQHALLTSVASHALELLEIDEHQAMDLFVAHWQEIHPSVVQPLMQASMNRQQADGNMAGYRAWRQRIHSYLDRLFRADPSAAAEYHGMQVELYADYAPDDLLPFLQSSQQYSLEKALEVCEARGLIKEQVYILQRMGNSRKAVELLIDKLGDLQHATALASEQQDADLWDYLVQLTVKDAVMTGRLLDHVGGYIDPLQLLTKIPAGMEIERLRDRLVKIIADYRTHTSLREGCNRILQHDCCTLQQRFYRDMQSCLRSFYIGSAVKQQRRGKEGAREPAQADTAALRWEAFNSITNKKTAIDVMELPGPLGALQLHIRPKDSTAQAQTQEAIKVWVGLVGVAAMTHLDGGPASAGSSAAALGKRRVKHVQHHHEQAQALPSLVAQ